MSPSSCMMSKGVPIHFLQEIGELQKIVQNFIKQQNYSQVFVLTDHNTSIHCYPLFASHLEILHKHIEIKAGEIHKTISATDGIWTSLTQHKADRNALLINLGGGMITDIGGFAASTYMRGIDCINIPTTLLSMVDASVGGKTGVDYKGFKNLIGTFSLPRMVLVVPLFLKTLSDREKKSGLAEMLKHALIAKEELWQSYVCLGQVEIMSHVQQTEAIKRSVGVKHRIVEEDYKEQGLRQLLNFGHTIGHAIEALYLERENALLHGEAIAIGMVAEAYLSHLYCELSKGELEEITEVLQSIYGNVGLQTEDYDTIIEFTKSDKKAQHSDIRFALLQKVGRGVDSISVAEEDIRKALDYYSSLDI